MTIYIALLRGINVGGKNIIKMSELKQSLISIGLLDVKTYIQIMKAESSSTTECLYVSFLTNEPTTEKIKFLDSYRSENEEYKIIGRDVYLLFYNSIRNSKLANNLQKLDETATVRNWKTINKLASLIKDM